jgi:hypothetical protein
MSRPITDPADRLGMTADYLDGYLEFIAALEKRYADSGAIRTQVPDFAERYANVCDLIVQLLWPEGYGAAPDDPFMHTSEPAREIARLIFHAAALDPDGVIQ